MTLEIPGNGYRFVIDPEKAEGCVTKHITWTKRLNRQGKNLMTMPDYYAFAKYAMDVLEYNGRQSLQDECYKLLSSIRKDFKDDSIITGSGIIFRGNSLEGTIIHHKNSKSIDESRINARIPVYDYDLTNDVVRSRDGLNLLQKTLLTDDNRRKIGEILSYLGNEKFSRIRTPKYRLEDEFMPITLDRYNYFMHGDYFFTGCSASYEVGCARAVKYISKGKIDRRIK